MVANSGTPAICDHGRSFFYHTEYKESQQACRLNTSERAMAGEQASKQQCAKQKQQKLVILLFTLCLAACPRFVLSSRRKRRRRSLTIVSSCPSVDDYLEDSRQESPRLTTIIVDEQVLTYVTTCLKDLCHFSTIYGQTGFVNETYRQPIKVSLNEKTKIAKAKLFPPRLELGTFSVLD